METSITQNAIAKSANKKEKWDVIWMDDNEVAWRKEALLDVYTRIGNIIRHHNKDDILIADIGGGCGSLLNIICDHVGLDKNSVLLMDQSIYALQKANDNGISNTRYIDLENPTYINSLPYQDIYISTECFEHLSSYSRRLLMQKIVSHNCKGCMISVPNNRLGPEEEPQHVVKFTAISFKRELEQYFDNVRIEVIGHYLLGVCGDLAKKNFTLSSTLPVRDEGHDLERTLASLRGVSDQLVVGIDPRTKDNTREIAELYADDIFFLENPEGPPIGHKKENCPICKDEKCKEYMGENGINFSWVRNQCIARCNCDWIFMTEGHERLNEGQDILLALKQTIPERAKIAFVMRQGNGQQWAFPWLFRNSKEIFFSRPVHNILSYPDGTFCVALPGIKMMHDRHHEREMVRAKQRKVQNRTALLDDWLSRKSEASLFYLGQEWRDIKPEKSIDRLEQFLTISNNGTQKYQARLVLAKEYMKNNDLKNAHNILCGCIEDDWTRSEHFIWMGDIAYISKEYERAYTMYTYSFTSVGKPPFTIWWIDLSYYSYLPAQRLAMVCCELDRIGEALLWAKKVVELLPDDSPQELIDEANQNVNLINDALLNLGNSNDIQN